MKTTNFVLNSTQLKGLTLASLLCLLIPVSIYGLWLYVFDLGTNQAERVIIFKDYFPDFLDGRWSTTLLSISFCILAIILSIVSLKLSSKIWNLLNIIILIISTLLLLLNIFSLI